MAPETVWLSFDTVIGRDVIIEPNVFFGPGVVVEDGAHIMANCHMVGARIGKGARVGPFARFRPGADIGERRPHRQFRRGQERQARDGRQGQPSRLHRRRSGGEGANIGAGTIFCNYDGFNKHFTDVGKGAFVGSNSLAGGAGQDRRWRLHRLRQRHQPGRGAGRPGARALGPGAAARLGGQVQAP